MGFLVFATILGSAALQDVMGLCCCGHHVRPARTDFDAVCEVLVLSFGGGAVGGLMSYTVASMLKWSIDNGWWSFPSSENSNKDG